MTDFPVFPSNDPTEWKFLAEGSDSILFGYVGTSIDSLKGKAMRLFKKSLLPNKVYITPEERKHKLQLHVNYIKRFAGSVLQDIDLGDIYTVTSEFIQKLAEITQPLRSERRVKESVIDVATTICCLHTNHCPMGSLTIEIKPKWGQKPVFPLIPADSVKRTVSRFQLLQRLKLAKGEIKSISEYEPEDLFSNDRQRITRAMEAMIKNPQGNLKFFVDNQQVDVDKKKALKFVDVLLQIPHLNQLLKIQSLDVIDIEGIDMILDRAGQLSWENLVEDQYVIDGVKKMLNGEIKVPETAEEMKKYLENLDEKQCRLLVAAFLIATAAKDCSFMFTFDNPEELKNPAISVIDFDMKYPENLRKYYLDIDRKIVATYLKSIGK